MLLIKKNYANSRACQGENCASSRFTGNRAYKYYLDGYKVNGKRKRIYFAADKAAEKELAEFTEQQKQEGRAGLDVPLDLRVMAVKAAKRLEPSK